MNTDHSRDLFSPDAPLILIGCGHMGQALVEGWRHAGVPADCLLVIDRNRDKLHALHTRLGISGFLSMNEWPASLLPAAIMLATKPAGLADLLAQLSARNLSRPPLILSVAAGKMLAFYEERLWPQTPVARVMPNTPATAREGMSICIGNDQVSETHRRLISTLMEAVGKVLWLDDEQQMHAATALAGSGPAYLFYLLECLIEAGMAEGLREEQARQLAVQTMKGAACLVEQSGEPISQLRNNVTSPGGTTAAALDVLMRDTAQTSLSALINEALGAAVQRSIALSRDRS